MDTDRMRGGCAIARRTPHRGRPALQRAKLPAAWILTLALGCALPGATLSPRQIFDRSVPSVFRIEAMTRNGTMIGTGFAISDRRIVTNLHVIDGAFEVVLQSRDGLRLRARRIVAFDESQDLVILETDARDLRPLPLGDSNGLAAGDRIYAIGSPLGLDYTITDGLYSGRRQLDFRGGIDMLQVSVPLSQGSSGGPLLDERGQVIGVATLVFTERSFGGSGAGGLGGLGIPSNALREISLARTGGERFEDFAARRRPEALPRAPRREIPEHPIDLLADCTRDHIGELALSILEAIERGAPAYNRGRPEECFRIYQGTARRLRDSLGPACSGGRQALEAGLARADTLTTDVDKAWAMRDTFDGLLDVIDRYLESQQPPD